MGTLDDAIREHLELKRRQGASDEELEQKQAEVLGRGQAPVQPAGTQEPPPADPGPEPTAAVPEPPEIVEEPDLPAVDPQAGRNGFSDTVVEPDPQPVPAADPLDLIDDDLADRGGAPPDEPTVRRTARPDPEPESDPADPPEDFLEETPEFLEETPEHDRLWFEQGPPKDFDFD